MCKILKKLKYCRKVNLTNSSFSSWTILSAIIASEGHSSSDNCRISYDVAGMNSFIKCTWIIEKSAIQITFDGITLKLRIHGWHLNSGISVNLLSVNFPSKIDVIEILMCFKSYWNNVLTSSTVKGTLLSEAFKHSPKQPFAVQPVRALIGREI